MSTGTTILITVACACIPFAVASAGDGPRVPIGFLFNTMFDSRFFAEGAGMIFKVGRI
jgi:hypothetical protein